MNSSALTTVLATYRVVPEHETAFRDLLARHWPTLHHLGLATDDPPRILRGEEDGRPVYFELFTWRDAEAPRVAHETPEVMAIWEPMGALTERRGERPDMEFPHLAEVSLERDA